MGRFLRTSVARSRWAAVGTAVVVTIGSGGLMSASATLDTGERAVFVPITPCRVMDTRPAPSTVGSRSTPLGTAETHSIAVLGTNGNCTIPADAVGLSLNVTAINPSSSSFLTIFPFGAPRPLASNLNWVAGQAPVPNAVTADIGGGGQISFFNLAGSVDVAADIVGYYVDHTHDDRYYTKTQVDASLALKANLPVTSAQILDGTITSADIAANSITSDHVLDFSLSNQDVNVFFAVVNGNGTLARSSGGVTSSRPSTGSYDVNFGRAVNNCSYVADVNSGPAFTDVASVSANVVNVHRHVANGDFQDGQIYVQVVC